MPRFLYGNIILYGTGGEGKTAGNRINTAEKMMMKRMILVFVAVLGLTFAANAQADQCALSSGNGGRIDAEVTGSLTGCSGDSQSYVQVCTKPSVTQPKPGTVKCEVVYKSCDGEEESYTALIYFDVKGDKFNTIYLPTKAARILRIRVSGAECRN